MNWNTVHTEQISITRVAFMLNVNPLTIKRWYKWAMNTGKTIEEVGLPQYTTDNRGTWFFNLEQVNELQNFRQNLKWGQMAEFNSKYYWSKKKGEDNE